MSTHERTISGPVRGRNGRGAHVVGDDRPDAHPVSGPSANVPSGMDDAATVDHEVAIERRFDDPSHVPREVGRHRERRVGFSRGT